MTLVSAMLLLRDGRADPILKGGAVFRRLLRVRLPRTAEEPLFTGALVHITLTPNCHATKILTPRDAPLEVLAASLQVHEVGTKDGEAFIPARFAPCGPPCRGTHGVTCEGAHRLAVNVTHMTGLAVDLDHLPPGELELIIASFASRGLEFVWWHTHSYAPEKVCARLLFPFAEELPLSSARAWSRTYWPKLMAFLGLAAEGDSACRDPARLYYEPRKPEGGLHQAGRSKGVLLDWRPILGDLSAELPAPAPTAAPTPEEDESRPVPLDEVRARLASISVIPASAFLQRVLKGEAPTPPPEQRQKGEASRYEAWLKVTYFVALCAEPWMSSTALVELLRPAWLAEVAESPNDHTQWERVKDLLKTARPTAKAAKAKRTREVNALRNKMMQGSPEMKAEGAPPSPPSEEGKEREAELARRLTRLPGKQPGEVGPLRQDPENIRPFLELHPDWHGALRFNSFSQKIEVWGGPLLQAGETPGRPLRDADIGACRDWLAGRQLRCSDTLVGARLYAAAEKCSYNPLQDYLRGLVWDGEDRLTNFLIRYFGAKTEDAGEDISPYLRAIGKKWLISAAARALNPGCKVDAVLEFEGIQGSGKSTALSILGGQFFSDEPIVMAGDKDSLLAMAGVWIIELAEMASYSRSEVARQKEFISRCTDRYRPPYGRNTIEVPRTCVFAATTNEVQYLSDTTGNRRHWPVSTAHIDLGALRQDRDQIWAEAVARYQAGESCFLGAHDLVVRRLAETQADARMVGDTTAQAIESWFLHKSIDKRPRVLTMLEICVDILAMPPDPRKDPSIGKSATRAGLKHTRRRVNGKPTWLYVVPERLLQAPQITAAQRNAQDKGLSVVPDAVSTERE